MDKEKINARAREWYHKNKKRILLKLKDKKIHRSPRVIQYRVKNREKIITWRKEWAKKRRREILLIVGGSDNIRCNRCGFEDSRALQIDHKFGCGNKNRISLQTKRFMEEVKNFPAKFQILCANCNWIKRIENQEFSK